MALSTLQRIDTLRDLYRGDGDFLGIERECYGAAKRAAEAVEISLNEEQEGQWAYSNWRLLNWLWGRQQYRNPEFRRIYTNNHWRDRFRDQLAAFKDLLTGAPWLLLIKQLAASPAFRQCQLPVGAVHAMHLPPCRHVI